MTVAATGWRARLGSYANPGMRVMLFLGFSSGLPFPLVLTTLSLRLREAGIDRTTIGFFSLVGLAYSLKFFWSPIVDRLPLPLLQRLGRRRSWMLLAQSGVIAGLIAMALHDPASGAEQMAWLAVFTAFCSATQDIAVDAFRIDSTPPEDQGPVVSAYATGYQLALICGGAGALVAASGSGWTFAYLLMTACMLVGPITTLLVAEPDGSARNKGMAFDPVLLQETIQRMRPVSLIVATLLTASVGALLAGGLIIAKQSATVIVVAFSAIVTVQVAMLLLMQVSALRPALEWLTGAVVLPLVDFFRRNGTRLAIPILLLILTYRLNYTTMGVAANTFYLDLGYTKDDIAVVAKIYGILMTIVGGLLAGWMVRRAGMMQTMLLGLVLLSVANLYYAFIATELSPYMTAHLAQLADAPRPSRGWLAVAVSIDNLANGIAGTAFIAYMSSLTTSAYTATQYALFGTLWSLPAKSIASQWGRIVDAYGYAPFFVYTALIALPALLMLLWFLRRQRNLPKTA